MKTSHPFKLLAAASAAMLLVACQTTPPANSDLTAARANVERARNDPDTARSAALELDRAQQSLRTAEAAWAKDRDEQETRHLSYMASQRAEIALAAASQARYDLRLQQGSAERERVRLEARTREAAQAEQQARAAQAAAMTAQANARLAQGDAEASRAQAEAARAQAARERDQAALARDQAAQQAARAASLESDLAAALQARNTERGMVVTLGDVLFDTGRATLQPGAQRSVEQLATILRQYPERHVMIEGFTDSVGSDAMNLDLSRRRAQAFQQALSSNGVGADRMAVRAFGEGFPVADNGTPAGRQQNRRVEIVFSDPQGRFPTDR